LPLVGIHGSNALFARGLGNSEHGAQGEAGTTRKIRDIWFLRST
jgi:hypothetical protein